MAVEKHSGALGYRRTMLRIRCLKVDQGKRLTQVVRGLLPLALV
jgi:hypothetical protein